MKRTLLFKVNEVKYRYDKIANETFSLRNRGPFLESRGNLSGLRSIFLNVFSPITQ